MICITKSFMSWSSQMIWLTKAGSTRMLLMLKCGTWWRNNRKKTWITSRRRCLPRDSTANSITAMKAKANLSQVTRAAATTRKAEFMVKSLRLPKKEDIILARKNMSRISMSWWFIISVTSIANTVMPSMLTVIKCSQIATEFPTTTNLELQVYIRCTKKTTRLSTKEWIA